MSTVAKDADIVVGVLESLVARLRARDVEGGLRLLHPTWFVASAQAVLIADDGNEQSPDYRLSGVLREHNPGEWLFELFNGSEPAQG